MDGRFHETNDEAFGGPGVESCCGSVFIDTFIQVYKNDNILYFQDNSGSYGESAKFFDNIRVKDVMLMALNYYIKHKLTQEGLEDLMKMLNVLTVGKTFPESLSTFTSAFPPPYETERVFFLRKMSIWVCIHSLINSVQIASEPDKLILLRRSFIT